MNPIPTEAQAPLALTTISRNSPSKLLAALAPETNNPVWFKGQFHDSVAAAFNACKAQCQDNAERVELMYNLVRANLKQHPELQQAIANQGGADWLAQCDFEVGFSLAVGWGGDSLEDSPYLQCLYDAHVDVQETQASRDDVWQVAFLGSGLHTFATQQSQQNAVEHVQYSLYCHLQEAGMLGKSTLRLIVDGNPGISSVVARAAIPLRDWINERQAARDQGEAVPNKVAAIAGNEEYPADSLAVGDHVRIELVVAVPCREHDSSWEDKFREAHAALLDAADEVRLVDPGHYQSPAQLLARNDWMVQQLDPKQLDMLHVVQVGRSKVMERAIDLATERSVLVNVYDAGLGKEQRLNRLEPANARAARPRKRQAVEAER